MHLLNILIYFLLAIFCFIRNIYWENQKDIKLLSKYLMFWNSITGNHCVIQIWLNFKLLNSYFVIIFLFLFYSIVQEQKICLYRRNNTKLLVKNKHICFIYPIFFSDWSVGFCKFFIYLFRPIFYQPYYHWKD